MYNNNNINQCTITPEPTKLNQCTITPEPTKLSQYTISPQSTKLNQFTIPTELTELNQWVAWSGKKRDNGKMDKIPIDPNTGSYAKVNKPSTWGTFQQAVDYWKANSIDGIGFVFTDSDPFVGIDLDHCVDKGTQCLTPDAAAIVKRFGSYTEFSPSGTGVHIIVKGSLPDHGRKDGYIEMYDHDRFFTFTGDILKGSPCEVVECQNELLKFHREHFSAPAEIKTKSSFADDDIIQKAMNAGNGTKFKQLWEGDHSNYPSQSEADLALCCMLAFWTQGNTYKIDQLFRQSGLFRSKWNRSFGGKKYGQATIDKALVSTTEYFGPGVQLTTKTEAKPPEFNLTDLGNAERLLHHHGPDVRYCHAWKSWLIWDGRRWMLDKCDRIRNLAKGVVRLIYAEAKQALDSAERREIAKHAMKSESYRSLNAMVSLAESQASISPDELDQDPWLFNCKNGTLNLESGKLQDHNRKDYITKMATVAYDPNAPHPVWDAFLNRILDDDRDLMAFMQRCQRSFRIEPFGVVRFEPRPYIY